MNTQPSLFDVPAVGAARRADPETSKEAAQSVTATALESLVMRWLHKRPSGLTTHELAELTGLSLVSVSPRIAPLVRKGFVKDSGERRPGPSGRKSIVWKVS